MNLAEYLRENSRPLEPVPTGEKPVLKSLDGVRSVVFDIYGTLVISAAGDISLVQENASEVAMERAGVIAPGAAERYHELIAEQQARSKFDFPEVEIREVWRELTGETDADRIEEIAVAYECHANPVWPMPNCAEVIDELRNRGLKLGIVSNAQFYTRLMFPAFLGADLEGLGFDPELMIFSYEEGEGKPSRGLYRKLAEQLRARGIEPGETLYVGNDMRKDIAPAAEIGFQTALFAGDKRSLRKPVETAEVEPDWVLTDLSQLL
ncbi:MAG: HAD family hydrolase [Verrucomicrobiales bacterium]|nr:HAD family hydrolase [Verrucomicrobiales bacterium]